MLIATIMGWIGLKNYRRVVTTIMFALILFGIVPSAYTIGFIDDVAPAIDGLIHGYSLRYRLRHVNRADETPCPLAKPETLLLSQ
jgi:hypothetical protein